MIYLASPYSHPDPVVRKQRFDAACRATAALLRAGRMIFSPIAHTHPLTDYGLPTGWDYWEHFDREHLERCDELLVLMLDGWRDSAGVQAEIRMAEDLCMAVRYVMPEDVVGTAEVGR